jgi:phage shock protein E
MGFFSKLFGTSNNNEAVQQAINNGAFLVDVRGEDEFAGGSAKGAVNIPLHKIQSQLARFKNKEAVIVFCRSGNRSSMAKTILEKNGVPKVINGGTWKNVANLVS